MQLPTVNPHKRSVHVKTIVGMGYTLDERVMEGRKWVVGARHVVDVIEGWMIWRMKGGACEMELSYKYILGSDVRIQYNFACCPLEVVPYPLSIFQFYRSPVIQNTQSMH